jgi:hypothetical protein
MQSALHASPRRWWVLLLGLASALLLGCGTVYIEEELEARVFNLGGTWVSDRATQLHQSFSLDRGTGTATFGFRDEAGAFDVPAAYALTKKGVSEGEFDLVYRPTEDQRRRYTEAVRAYNSGEKAGAGMLPEDLVIDRRVNQLLLSSERGYAVRLTAVTYSKGRPEGK